MNKPMPKFIEQHLTQILEGKVTSLAWDGESELAGLMVRMPNGTTKICWILCDPEGNGPGHLDISDHADVGLMCAVPAEPMPKQGSATAKELLDTLVWIDFHLDHRPAIAGRLDILTKDERASIKRTIAKAKG